MAHESKKKNILSGISAKSTKETKRHYSTEVDLGTSVGQTKCSGQLSQIFNLLDQDQARRSHLDEPLEKKSMTSKELRAVCAKTDKTEEELID